MVEMAIILPLLLTLLLGFVDFGYAFYQWNAADKAVQVGARLARISTPIAVTGIKSEAGTPADTTQVGNAVPAGTYSYRCSEDATGTVSCTCPAGTCQDLTANKAAFNRIFCGDRPTCGTTVSSCQGGTNPGRPGMCDFFPGLSATELRVEYIATGLGYWTRPGGPVPTISVSIIGHPFQFFFLGGLLNFANITMPNMASTVTGEDLSACFPSTSSC